MPCFVSGGFARKHLFQFVNFSGAVSGNLFFAGIRFSGVCLYGENSYAKIDCMEYKC